MNRKFIILDICKNSLSFFHNMICFATGAKGIYIENNTWVRGNTTFISSVEHDISRVSAANE